MGAGSDIGVSQRSIKFVLTVSELSCFTRRYGKTGSVSFSRKSGVQRRSGAPRRGEMLRGAGEPGRLILETGDKGTLLGEISPEYRRDGIEAGGTELFLFEDFRCGIGGGNFVSGTGDVGCTFRPRGDGGFDRSVDLRCGKALGGAGKESVEDVASFEDCLGSVSTRSDSFESLAAST